MKHGLLKEIDWAYVGACLANEGDIEQAQFFSSFVKECNSWGTKYQIEQQLAFINLKLSEDEKKTLSMLSYQECN